jgi:S1-C subfamily serine protease
MGLHILINTALILAQSTLGPIRTASDETILAQIVVKSDNTGTIGAAIAQNEQDTPRCGWIGVQVSAMTRPFADSLGMTEIYGAIFDQPQPNGPAAQAKIQAGDVITAINGSPLASWKDFTPAISAMAPGTDVYLTTYRDGQLIDVSLILGSSKCP